MAEGEIVGKEKIRIRIFNIPGYNNEKDVERSKLEVNRVACEIEVFTYCNRR